MKEDEVDPNGKEGRGTKKESDKEERFPTCAGGRSREEVKKKGDGQNTPEKRGRRDGARLRCE